MTGGAGAIYFKEGAARGGVGFLAAQTSLPLSCGHIDLWKMEGTSSLVLQARR